MKHWTIDQLDWEAFDPSKLDPALIPLIKAASVVERNAPDYTRYLQHVFADDAEFSTLAESWADEEVQHGDALGRWAMLADPEWDYKDAFRRYREAYRIDTDLDTSIRGSRTGELIARCMVETGTSSYYSALADATEEPVLKQLCKQIAADEFRHFKLFYDHMKRYLAREKLGRWARLRIALGRVMESEDDELATAYHITNEPVALPYDHGRCTAAYMAGALGVYRQKHFDRVTAMILKASGLTPRSGLQRGLARVAYGLSRLRHRSFVQRLRKLGYAI
ncbi:acyl-ACP desaturase [Oecophyllibacter saccharovorans]|uniref:acyl-ACP desaturase n=1 Tax=Oecophyllibacter saccharovorans TaxID=2558360 RepID=UPI001167BADC|nr:ferritin-like domain-containing protein [Oecophyllibacter saccharovorans]TPW34734.1 ferritin-like domain-containing protein [Oecophyllibacter saccharovorans]